ncbi:MAG: hypothetical protein J3K34DRAFT_5325 [Monoraphidium minutum]|nr:MAG: hypothetical protein J3K34DRAFT_5325 [Monoraphidium minutum]
MAASIKDEIKALMQQKEAAEREIAERMTRLDAPGGPGMDQPLVDGEGYPRADVDVHAARVDRSAVIRLTNDHKELMGRIERLMHALHAAARDSGDGPAAAAANGNGHAAAAAAPREPPAPPQAAPAAAAPAPSLRPFAVVDEVAEGSPASDAGIQLGDQLCRFGAVTPAPPGQGGGDELARVAAALQAAEGRGVEVVFLRHGAPVALALTPRRWAGRGLLGCHLRPLGRP